MLRHVEYLHWESWYRRGSGQPLDSGINPNNTWLLSLALNDDTKILNETDTETFYPIPNFPKPILFFRDQILWNRNQNSPKSWQQSRDRDRNRDCSISLIIFGEIFLKYFPLFPSFYPLLQKKYIYLLWIFSSIFFSSGIERQRQRQHQCSSLSTIMSSSLCFPPSNR